MRFSFFLAGALAALPAAAQRPAPLEMVQEQTCAERGAVHTVSGDVTTTARVEPWSGAAIVGVVQPSAPVRWEFDVKGGLLFLRVRQHDPAEGPFGTRVQLQVRGEPGGAILAADLDLVALFPGDPGERTRAVRLLPECP